MFCRTFENFVLLIHKNKQNEKLVSIYCEEIWKGKYVTVVKWEHIVKKIEDFENHRRFILRCLGKGITPVILKQEHHQYTQCLKLLEKLKDN